MANIKVGKDLQQRKIIVSFGWGIALAVFFGIWSLAGSPSSASKTQNSPQFFPIELINVDDPGDFPEVAAAGFNVVQSYRFEGIPPWGKTDAEAIKYLDAAHKAGLKVEVGIPQEAVQVPGSADKQDLAFIKQRIRTIKDHPAVWVYKLFDEPESAGYGRDEPVRPVNFNNVYNAIKQLDTIHPVLNTANGAIDGTYPYLGVDIIMLQYSMLPPGSYPVPWNKLENLREAHRSSFDVLASKRKPFVFAIQAYNLANDPDMWPGILEYNPEAVARYPTRAEMRFMAYSGIILGAKGITFTCYKTYDENGDPLEDISRTANPSQWQAVSSVSKELQALSPIFLAPQSQVKVTATEGDAGKEFLLKEYQGKLYLLAINPKDKRKTITFTFSKSLISVKVLGESRTILPQANSFTDDFDGYGVHWYEIATTGK